jgi:hypothetical protein
MRYVKSFMVFCYDFVIGDDWRMALGVVVGLALTALLAHNGLAAWWVLPIIVVLVVVISLRRARRKAAGK